MLEQQFVTFAASIEPHEEKPLTPLTAGSTGLEFYTPDPLTNCSQIGVKVSLVTPDGTQEYLNATISNPTDNHITIAAETGGIMTAATLLAAMGYGSSFRIKYKYTTTSTAPGSLPQIITKYSQTFILTDNSKNKLALLRYRCGTTTGGIPYRTGQYVSAWMPIWLDQPQFKQESEVYTKLDGSTAVLFATATKEYEAQTDYLPIEWHEKMVNALMSDEVFINGEALQKSDDYEIKWDSVETRHNTIKLAKAEWKMKACTLSRNTNA